MGREMAGDLVKYRNKQLGIIWKLWTLYIGTLESE